MSISVVERELDGKAPAERQVSWHASYNLQVFRTLGPAQKAGEFLAHLARHDERVDGGQASSRRDGLLLELRGLEFNPKAKLSRP